MCIIYNTHFWPTLPTAFFARLRSFVAHTQSFWRYGWGTFLCGKTCWSSRVKSTLPTPWARYLRCTSSLVWTNQRTRARRKRWLTQLITLLKLRTSLTPIKGLTIGWRTFPEQIWWTSIVFVIIVCRPQLALACALLTIAQWWKVIVCNICIF